MLILRISRNLWLMIFLQLHNGAAASLNATMCAHVCQSGECIYRLQLCDGIANCPDASDENRAVCSKVGCSSRSFRCKNGDCSSASPAACEGKLDCVNSPAEESWLCRAHLMQGNCNKFEILCLNGKCVPFAKLCDGSYDCLDGDDEAPTLCEGTTNRSTTTLAPHIIAELDQLDLAMRKRVYHTERNVDGCMLPILTNIIITTANNAVLQPGDKVSSDTSVHFDCSMAHVLKGQSFNFCQHTRWLHEFPCCEAPNTFVLSLSYMAALAALCFLMYRRCQKRSNLRDDRQGLVQVSHCTASVVFRATSD